MPALQQITGLVLAGGQGLRMGGADKGLVLHAGRPLAWHALQRLAPQVGQVAVSANRHLDAYAGLGVPVWPDSGPPGAHEGPLAGFLSALQRCGTPWLAAVPCDCPRFPSELVQRLAQAAQADDAEVAIAATRGAEGLRLEPAFCLMQQGLAPHLLRFMQGGGRRIEQWTAQHRRALAVFDDAEAFFNVNTPEDLARL